MKPIRIAVIGAGSATFSLNLINDLIKTPEMAESEVVLMDVDAERLETVHEIAKRFVKEVGGKISFYKTLSLKDAVKDSDFVVNVALAGGYNYLEKVRKIGQKWGYYRGIDSQNFNMVSDYYTVSNFNQFKLFVDVAEHVVREGSFLVHLSNPLLEGTTLVSRIFPELRFVGLCHGYHGVFEILRVLEIDKDSVEWQVAGLNHAIWLVKFEKDGEDLYDRLREWFDENSDWKPSDPFDVQMSKMAKDMMDFYGVIPVGDTVRNSTWRYHRDLETKKFWYGEPWGGPDSEVGWEWYQNLLKANLEFMRGIAESTSDKRRIFQRESLMEIVRRKNLPEHVVDELSAVFDPESLSEESIVPFLKAFSGGGAERIVVNVRNEGIIDGIPEDVVVEIPAVVKEESIEPERADVPERVLKYYISGRLTNLELSVGAFIEKRFDNIKEILYRDPRTRNDDQVEGVLSEIASLPENEPMRKHYNLKG